MAGRPTRDDDDASLFREAIGPVRPLKSAHAPERAPPPPPEPVQAQRDEARVAGELLTHPLGEGDLEAGDSISYVKAGQSPRLLQKLRRGHFSVRAEIDLHDMTSTVAAGAIRAFLDQCRRDGVQCVRIVHGKGLRSRHRGPVLKQLTDRLLRRRADVLAFASARPVQGGTGAVLVLLGRG